MPLPKRVGAEFIGTFWLVFGGCGSAVLAASSPRLESACSGLLWHSGFLSSPWPTRSDTFQGVI